MNLNAKLQFTFWGNNKLGWRTHVYAKKCWLNQVFNSIAYTLLLYKGLYINAKIQRCNHGEHSKEHVQSLSLFANHVCLQEATSLGKFGLLCNHLLLFWISVTVIVISSELSYYRTALWDRQQSSRGSFGQIMHTLTRQKACERARNAGTNIMHSRHP